MDFCHQGPCQNRQAPNLITKWLGAWLLKSSGVCRYAVRRGHQPSLMKPPPVKVWLVFFVPPLSERVRKTESHGHSLPKSGKRWGGSCGRRSRCRPGQTSNGLDVQSSTNVMMMKWSASGHYFAHWWMGEELRHGVLHAACYQCGNGPLSCTPHPALLPQPTWRSGAMAASGSRGPRGKQGRSMDRGLCLLLTMHVAEASSGRSWVTEGEGMAPQVSPLAQAFLSAMGRHVSLSILWECWPPKHDIVPRQPMNEVQAHSHNPLSWIK